MKSQKISRRSFLATGLTFTLGGCATNSLSFGSRAPASKPLDFLRSRSLSNEFSELRDEKQPYEAVVIGSGYGASVVAARLAGKFKDLCVLERGREFLPGDFPTSPMALAKSLRTSINPLGLFDVSNGSDVDIVCGNGLGGTSLINAAIAIKPEKNIFAQSAWPTEIQEAAKNNELDKYYDLAESVLRPQQIIRSGKSAKSDNHRQITEQMKRPWGALKLNIRSENFQPGLNEYEFPQGPCVQCGDCCGGCNFGAKNTLATNYLSMAKKNGAKIFTQIEVASLEKVKDGYLIHTIVHGQDRVLYRTVKARKVFLGAGSKGSTHILFRSQREGFLFSSALGTRLSANGDVMGLAYNTRYKNNILGMARDPRLIDDSYRPGPIIASYADYRNPSLENDVRSQFLLLDGVIPSSMHEMAARAIATYVKKIRTTDFPKEQQDRIENDYAGTGDFRDGALNHSMLYFACGHDSSGGKFKYNRLSKNMDYVWKNVLKEKTFERINSVMHGFSEAMGGLFIPNPRSAIEGMGQNIQATHPLGGCPMGNSARDGVVDHMGRVFDAKGGLHENLFVVDAATIPHSLAATPLLTITALAERIADRLAQA